MQSPESIKAWLWIIEGPDSPSLSQTKYQLIARSRDQWNT